MAVGRSNESRTLTVSTTNLSANINAAAGSFHEEDVGRAISGTGIPAATTLSTITSDTAAVMSAAASATGSPSATLGAAAGTAYGFRGWSPETDAESETYSVTAAGTPPSVMADAVTRVEQRSRS